MQAIKQWNYCWYFSFFIIFGLLIVKNCFIVILKEKNDKVFTYNYVNFPNFKISASLLLEEILQWSKVEFMLFKNSTFFGIIVWIILERDIFVSVDKIKKPLILGSGNSVIPSSKQTEIPSDIRCGKMKHSGK